MRIACLGRVFAVGGGVFCALASGVDGAEPAVFENELIGCEGMEVRDAVCADFDGDGDVDLALAGGLSEDLCVLHNDGTGRFDYVQGFGNFVPSLGPLEGVDVNADGILDLVGSAQSGDTIAVCLGVGDGTFSPVVEIGVEHGATGIRVAEISGDGHVDLILVNYFDQTFSTLDGNGDGTFGNERVTNAGFSFPKDFQIHDLDSDGDLDLLLFVCGSGTLNVFLNDGAGGFSLTDQIPAEGFTVGAAIGDIDHDGALELFAAFNESETLRVFEFDEVGGVDTGIDLALSVPASQFEYGDVNGDGSEDLIVISSETDEVAVHTAQGGGGFASAVVSQADDVPRLMNLQDFDADGLVDFLFWHLDQSGLSLRRGFGDGTFESVPTFGISGFPRGVGLGDINSDGMLDAIVGIRSFGDGGFEVRSGDGLGGFGDAVVNKSTWLRSFAVRDLDGDGDTDVVVITAFEEFKVYRCDGAGGFTEELVASFMSDVDDIAFGDLNQDGFEDIVLVSSSSPIGVSVYLADGSGEYGSVETRYDTADARLVRVGDCNNDGFLDIVVIDTWQEERIFVFPGDGSGSMLDPVVHEYGFTTRAFELVDMDLDGELDIVTVGSGGLIVIRWGDAGFGFEEEPTLIEGLDSEHGFGVADLDRDCLPDLVVVSTNRRRMSVILNNGSRVFSRVSEHGTRGEPAAVGLGDLNGDGWIDAVSVNNRNEMGASVFLNQLGTQCAADLTGDGVLDFFDLSRFLVCFFAGGSNADINGDGELDFFDVSAFLAAFGAGCS